MSKTLILNLDDETYRALQHRAQRTGTSPEYLATTSLELQFGSQHHEQKEVTETQKQEARERFERHFGEVDLGYATGADNASIDADLAKEYSGNHEEE